MKLVVAGLVAAVQDDRDRNRYRLEYQLVRADSVGTWDKVLDDILTGPSSQFLDTAASSTRRELTEKSLDGSWQTESVHRLSESLRCVNLDNSQRIGRRVQGRTWFKDFVSLRNGTRGHGAPAASALGLACSSLYKSISVLAQNVPLFSSPWAYVYRNLSGKYRVTPWNDTGVILEDLKRNATYSFDHGVYIELGKLRHVALLDSDPEGSDFWLVNGGFSDKKYEMLSYWSNTRVYKPSFPFLQPAEELPPSETEGLGYLDVKGQTFTNVPEPITSYVPRPNLEKELEAKLKDSERHFTVSLTGSGGIGKTSTALKVIAKLIGSDDCPYDVVIWFSARDVDLSPSGPKAVKPHGLSIDDFAKEYTNLLTPGEMNTKGFVYREFLAKQLVGETIGPTLFVFDNFETTNSPLEVFKWLDHYVKAPNKVLITSRHRGFTGDYEVRVPGMNYSEAEELINWTAKAVGVSDVITPEYQEELISESYGHPYVIKLMIGEIARGSARIQPERIMAAQDEVLVALFERSYSKLSPAEQRVFLTLCKWRSSVPALAVEAVLMRPENERINVGEAIKELVQGFFVDEIVEENSGEAEISVPLAARLFGLRKLEVSVWRASIEADLSFLRLWGARTIGYTPELGSRIESLFRNVTEELSKGSREFENIRLVLEFLTTRYSYASVLMARLVSNHLNDEPEEERYLLNYVQGTEHPKMPIGVAWKRIAGIRKTRGDVNGELHALAQICRPDSTPASELSDTANKINSILSQISPTSISREEKQFLVRDVVDALIVVTDELDATDLSRLAWLQLHLDESASALETVNKGLSLDPNNRHCLSLQTRLLGFNVKEHMTG